MHVHIHHLARRERVQGGDAGCEERQRQLAQRGTSGGRDHGPAAASAGSSTTLHRRHASLHPPWSAAQSSCALPRRLFPAAGCPPRHLLPGGNSSVSAHSGRSEGFRQLGLQAAGAVLSAPAGAVTSSSSVTSSLRTRPTFAAGLLLVAAISGGPRWFALDPRAVGPPHRQHTAVRGGCSRMPGSTHAVGCSSGGSSSSCMLNCELLHYGLWRTGRVARLLTGSLLRPCPAC